MPEDSNPQEIPFTVYQLNLRIIFENQKTYINVPRYQRRRGIWTDEDEQKMLDLMLRGLPIPAIMTYWDMDDGNVYILDGLQRMNTMMRFLNDELRTMSVNQFRKRVGKHSTLMPREPGLKFSQLPKSVQNALLNYPVPLIRMTRLTDELKAYIYITLQGGKKPTVGEKLRAYASLSNDFAFELEWHPYFKAEEKIDSKGVVYKDTDYRSECFQMSHFVLCMELTSLYKDLREKHLQPVAAGEYDERLTEEKKEQIINTLDGVCHLFKGFSSYSRTELIPLYQAVVKLRDRGLDWRKAKEGTLTPWIFKIKLNAERDSWGHTRTFGRLLDASRQERFWGEQEEEMLKASGLVWYPTNVHEVSNP